MSWQCVYTLRVDKCDECLSTMHHNLLYRSATRTSFVLKVQLQLVSVNLLCHVADQDRPW